jgi:hypothetical protein
MGVHKSLNKSPINEGEDESKGIGKEDMQQV